MKLSFISFFILFFTLGSHSQNLTGQQLLQKSIAYHDPGNKWSTFKGGLHLRETRPSGADRLTHLHLNNKTSFFELIQHREKDELVHVWENEKCVHLLNKSKIFSDTDREKHKLTCDRTKLLRDYYLYLWGLPMKLNDAGTNIAEEVGETEFQGNKVWSMKVTYETTVGDDTWYFYFDQRNYAMVGYRFYHEEEKNDGEYITLDGEETIKNIRFPKTRKWYYNKDDKFLGADILETN